MKLKEIRTLDADGIPEIAFALARRSVSHFTEV